MYERYYIEKPPMLDEDEAKRALLSLFDDDERTRLEPLFDKVSNQKYLYWDKAKYYLNRSAEDWLLIRQLRKMASVDTKIKSEAGSHFTWYRPLYTDKFLREIDMYTGGILLSDSSDYFNERAKQKYLARGIVEESISSSQLEGADTASKYAKKMLTENIKPRTKGEQMIVNNYRVLKKIESEYSKEDLSIYLLQLIQSELTEGTLDEGLRPGELRKDSDEVKVIYDEKIIHVPPKANFVASQLSRLIKYANDDSDYIHPVIKAIELHFWIGYLHPFPDGNGRLARTIFYWYLFRHGYWAVGYIPISTVLKRSQHDYGFSYIYAEQDDLDFTYFFDYNIRCMLKAIKSFTDYINKKTLENTTIKTEISRHYPSLNARELSAVEYLLRAKDATTSIKSYSIMNGVTEKTAQRDLKKLKEQGIIDASKKGRSVSYRLSSIALTELKDAQI